MGKKINNLDIKIRHFNKDIGSPNETEGYELRINNCEFMCHNETTVLSEIGLALGLQIDSITYSKVNG